MFGDEFAIDLKTWKKVCYSSLGGGNQITSARLHALQMMVDEERHRFSWEGELSEKLVLMDTLSNLCLFAKVHGSAAEKTIFLHIMIDLIYDYEKRHEEPPRRLQVNPGINWDEAIGDVYPTEDSPDNLIPPADLGNIPF
jgi:hypothetical protein